MGNNVSSPPIKVFVPVLEKSPRKWAITFFYIFHVYDGFVLEKSPRKWAITCLNLVYKFLLRCVLEKSPRKWAITAISSSKAALCTFWRKARESGYNNRKNDRIKRSFFHGQIVNKCTNISEYSLIICVHEADDIYQIWR